MFSYEENKIENMRKQLKYAEKNHAYSYATLFNCVRKNIDIKTDEVHKVYADICKYLISPSYTVEHYVERCRERESTVKCYEDELKSFIKYSTKSFVRDFMTRIIDLHSRYALMERGVFNYNAKEYKALDINSMKDLLKDLEDESEETKEELINIINFMKKHKEYL